PHRLGAIELRDLHAVDRARAALDLATNRLRARPAHRIAAAHRAGRAETRVSDRIPAHHRARVGHVTAPVWWRLQACALVAQVARARAGILGDPHRRAGRRVDVRGAAGAGQLGHQVLGELRQLVLVDLDRLARAFDAGLVAGAVGLRAAARGQAHAE